MSDASLDVMRRAGVTMHDIALVVPHQANLRIMSTLSQNARGRGPEKGFFDRAEIRQYECGHGARSRWWRRLRKASMCRPAAWC